MANKPAAKFNANDNAQLKGIENGIGALNDALNPFSGNASQVGQLPFYSTGARALVRYGGKPLGIAQEIRWNIQYNVEPINTVDTPHAYDVDVGQSKIAATLSQFIDPTAGPESAGLFHIMPAAVHQPFIEMQVLDKFGTSIFFARGMFTSVSGAVARGQMSNYTCNFVGVAYQHYVAQTFVPYSTVSKLAGLLTNLQNTVSDLSGGIL